MGPAHRGRIENWQTDSDCCRCASFRRSPRSHCAIASARLPNRTTVACSRRLVGDATSTWPIFRPALRTAKRLQTRNAPLARVTLSTELHLEGLTRTKTNQSYTPFQKL